MESVNILNIEKKPETLDEAIEQSRLIYDYFLKDKINDCNEYVEAFSDDVFYISAARSFIKFVFGFLTCNQLKIKDALESVKHTIKLSNQHKKNISWSESVSNFLKGVDYDAYTDDELHAEVVTAECKTAFGILSVISEPGLMSVVKAAYNIKTAFSSYKFCVEVMKNRTIWKTKAVQKEFECAVNYGHGLANLTLSGVPDRVMKIMALVGLKGCKKDALNELKAAYEHKSSLRHGMLCFSMSIKIMYMDLLFGIPGDLDWITVILTETIEKYPQSALVNMFHARLLLLKGEPRKAIENLNISLNAKLEPNPFKSIIMWDMCWAFAIQSDWNNAIKSAKQLTELSEWSPCTDMYQYGAFLCMAREETNSTHLDDEIMDVMKSVNLLKKKHFGKTVPAEKFAGMRAKKYLEEGDLMLPALEILYIWNTFGFAGGKEEYLIPILRIIIKKLCNLNQRPDANMDDLALLLALKGVCYKLIKKTEEAFICFQDILNNGDKINKDTFLVPIAALETGLTYINLEKYDDAKEWLTKAKENYSGYLCETLLHLRVFAGFTLIDDRMRIE